MAELAKMYPPQANTPETSLSGALTAAGTTVNVVDGTMLPDAPNLLTIGADGSTAETVLMTEKSGNVLTVVRGQDGTTARAWSAGDVIGRYFTAADQKAMQDNITALFEIELLRHWKISFCVSCIIAQLCNYRLSIILSVFFV